MQETGSDFFQNKRLNTYVNYYYFEIKEDFSKQTSAGRNISSQHLENAITTETLMDARLSLISWIMEIMEDYKQEA